MNNTAVMDLISAYSYCQKITQSHYENFPVASLFIPANYRPHIFAIYAFARTADDFSDEEHDRRSLLDWRERLLRCTTEKPEHPIFLALGHTIRRFDLPLSWLDDLLTAFLIDLDTNRYRTMEDLHHYCRYSANPVGRIILWIFGYRDKELMNYSDFITTALQLANFWQDISVDIKKNRLYIPAEFLRKFQVSEQEIFQQRISHNFVQMINALVDYNYRLFKQGFPLVQKIEGRLQWEIKLTVAGGLEILKKVKHHLPHLLHDRPVLNRWDWMKIIISHLLR